MEKNIKKIANNRGINNKKGINVCPICGSNRILFKIRGGKVYKMVCQECGDTRLFDSTMDEEIGFPIKGQPDYDKLAPLFF